MTVAIVPKLTPGWLKNSTFDLSLIAGITLASALVAYVAKLDPIYFEILILADLWILGYHHVIATFTKLAGTAEDRRRNFPLIWLLLPGILLTTIGFGLMYGIIYIVTIYFFWQWFHYTRQSWGIAQRYRHRSGVMSWDDVRLSEITMWSVPVWGVLNRCYQGADTFLFMPVYMPPVPLWLVQLAGVCCAGLLSWWVISRFWAWRRGELALGHTLYMASHFIVFGCAYILFSDMTIGWLMINVWHNTQYLAFVWMHNRQRFSCGISADGLVISWLSQPGFARATIYFGACLLVSTAIYIGMSHLYPLLDSNFALNGSIAGLTSITFLILFSMGINFHHYIVDSIIWRRKYERQS